MHVSEHSYYLHVNFVRVKWNLRSKAHRSFYDTILMTLCKKISDQSSVMFWSVIKKLRGCKVLDPVWVTYLQMYRSIHSWFSMHIVVNFMEKEPFTRLYGRFYRFLWTHEVPKFWTIKLCLDINDVNTRK